MTTTVNGTSIFEESNLNITTTRVRRCGHCRQPGHDIRRCPEPAAQRIVALRRARAAARAAARRQRRQDAMNSAATRPARSINNDSRIGYKFFNNTPSYISLWWGKETDDNFQFLSCMASMGDYNVRALPVHRFIAISESRYCDLSRDESININDNDIPIAGDFLLGNFEDREIHICGDFRPPKPPLDQWKECGLKAMFLLKEIERLGGNKYENLEPILDMVQDITIPEHTETDKESAGIPSTFTNLT